MSGSSPLTVVITIPTDDRSFERYVRDAFARIGAHGTGAGPGPAHPSLSSLEATVRERYPTATVRARGLSGEPFAVWYVYRDGGWRPSRPHADREDRG